MSVVTISREGTVAVVTIDNPPVNALSLAVRRELADAVSELDTDPDISAVVLVCAGRTFVAGADVTEFDKPPQPPHLPDLVGSIEAARKPWIAAIHGSALGGGLEVALGCRFRIATAEASLGFPEVTLGIVPGAGGTVRSLRLVGVEAAVELVTTGRSVRAPRALELGLIDEMADGDLRTAAIALARERLAHPLPEPLVLRPAPVAPDAFWTEAETTIGRRAKGEAAPLRALGCLRRATETDFVSAMLFERETFLDLRGSTEAAALRHVFFAERAATRPALGSAPPLPLRRAAVVGGGTMGAGIVAALRDGGLPCVLVERDGQALARGMDNVRDIFQGSVRRGRLTQADAEVLLAGVTGSTDYAALAETDLVIEAVFEELSVKRKVFQQLDRVCRPDAILATNTSYLDPRAIVEGLAQPDRFIGLHFFSPANVMKLLEIVPVPETSDTTVALAFALARILGKIPIRAGICEGFIGNRILKRYRAEAEMLVRRGVAISAVDAAMRDYGFAMGPFEAQDLGGLDIAFLQREAARTAGEDVPEALADILVRAGRKGQKTGGGWYDYEAGHRRPLVSEEVSRLLASHITPGEIPGGKAIAERLVEAMACEGDAILAEGIAEKASDIDLVEIHGYGFPRRRGGPMFGRKPS